MWLPIVYAVLAGSVGTLILFSAFYLGLPGLFSLGFVFSPALVWLSGYFLTKHFLPSWKPRERAYVSVIGYLVAGAVTILLSAAWLGMNPFDPAFQVILWPPLVALASYVLLRTFFRGRKLWASVSLSLLGYVVTFGTLFYFLVFVPAIGQVVDFVWLILGWPVFVVWFLLGSG